MNRRTWLLGLMGLLSAGCFGAPANGASSGSGGSCIAGQSSACACPGGGVGAQVCLSAGIGFGTCDCAVQTTASSGASTGTSGSTATSGSLGSTGTSASHTGSSGTSAASTTASSTSGALAPNIMLVIDRSGSMADNAAGTVSGACAPNGVYGGRGPDCKWNNLLDVLLGPAGSTGQGFLANLDTAFATNAAAGDPVRIGLTSFSGASSNSTTLANECSVGQVQVNVAAATESAISATLLATVPSGGTPTAATLTLLPPAFPSGQRASFAILLTDGAPNCDSSFPLSSTNCIGDRCTLGPCPAAGTPSCACFNASTNSTLLEGCLDEDASVTAVTSLYSAGIRTFIIGFGAVTVTPSTTETLNNMGRAGGSAADPSGNYFYQANSAQDLQNALSAILGIVTHG